GLQEEAKEFITKSDRFYIIKMWGIEDYFRGFLKRILKQKPSTFTAIVTDNFGYSKNISGPTFELVAKFIETYAPIEPRNEKRTEMLEIFKKKKWNIREAMKELIDKGLAYKYETWGLVIIDSGLKEEFMQEFERIFNRFAGIELYVARYFGFRINKYGKVDTKYGTFKKYMGITDIYINELVDKIDIKQGWLLSFLDKDKDYVLSILIDKCAWDLVKFRDIIKNKFSGKYNEFNNWGMPIYIFGFDIIKDLVKRWLDEKEIYTINEAHKAIKRIRTSMEGTFCNGKPELVNVFRDYGDYFIEAVEDVFEEPNRVTETLDLILEKNGDILTEDILDFAVSLPTLKDAYIRVEFSNNRKDHIFKTQKGNDVFFAPVVLKYNKTKSIDYVDMSFLLLKISRLLHIKDIIFRKTGFKPSIIADKLWDHLIKLKKNERFYGTSSFYIDEENIISVEIIGDEVRGYRVIVKRATLINRHEEINHNLLRINSYI
ncbi:MAG: hypothetical protein ACYSSI_12770, partial [Planctomycetota bacterium]